LNPQLPNLYYERAQHYLDDGNYEKAIKDLSHSISLNPGDPAILCKRCQAFITINQPEKALADANESIHLNPKFAAAYGN
jgi:tetratricopeptide (TPR) repeat protein